MATVGSLDDSLPYPHTVPCNKSTALCREGRTWGHVHGRLRVGRRHGSGWVGSSFFKRGYHDDTAELSVA